MKEKTGDFWEEYLCGYDFESVYDAVVCTINQTVKKNGCLVMGAGIAKDFAQMFPKLPKNWGERVQKFPKKCIVSREKTLYLIGMPTKINWRDPSPIDLIENSAKQLVEIADFLKLKHILMTRPGCGHGGQNWEYVKSRISFLDDRFTVISHDRE